MTNPSASNRPSIARIVPRIRGSSGGKNPVLSHLFLNHMLDTAVSTANFKYIGYQPPQQSINPESLIQEGFIPKSLSAAIVRESDFTQGYPALELSTDNNNAWHSIWLAFKAGK